MKVAIVHDSLREFGGAERVLASLIKIWPKAGLYTSTVNNQVLSLLPPVKITTSFLNQLPYLKQKTSVLQMIAPLIWKGFNFEKYDLVISSSSFGLCNTIKVTKPIYVAYIHCPPKNLFSLDEKWTLQKIIPYSKIIGAYYIKSLKNTKHLVTNSNYMKSLLKKLFSVNATVIYPPVKIAAKTTKKSSKYFVTTSRLDKNKHIDLVIKVCNKLRLPLKVIGIGKHLPKLKQIAGPSIEFLGLIKDKKRNKIYEKAKAFIFCAKNEDFGIAPIEALACGVPVIAYYGGGAKETLIDKKTGLFFYNFSTADLVKTIKKFDPENFKTFYLQNYAQKFSEERFEKEFEKYVSNIIKSHTYK